MSVNKKKINVGLFSLTGCEGCYFAILDKTKEFIALNNKVNIINCRLFEDDAHFEAEQYDIAFIEGSPLTESNRKQVKIIRKNSKMVVALGACASLGGIYHIKEYHDKNKIFDHVYHNGVGVENYDVQTLDKLIKVDAYIPGCPITAKEFMLFIYTFLAGKKQKIPQNPVCYECQIRGYECLLQKGEVCLGPITCGGCGAVCLKSKQGCWGCRGLVEAAEVGNLVGKLREKYSDREITKYLEIFGIKAQINKDG